MGCVVNSNMRISARLLHRRAEGIPIGDLAYGLVLALWTQVGRDTLLNDGSRIYVRFVSAL